MTRTLLVIATLISTSAFTWSCRATRAADAAMVVTGPCDVALAPSGQRDDMDRQITRLQERARHDRDPHPALEQLGYRYVARARARHDDGDYRLAESVASCMEVTRPDDPAAMLLRGHALHQLHRFADAEQLARQLVARRGLALDYGLLGDALMEQGRLAEAGDAYQKMIDLKPFFQSYTRAAHLRWLRGDLDGAIEMMRMAIAAASPRDPDSKAWAYTRLASYQLQRGNPQDAARAVDAAVDEQPAYAAALLTRGRILVATGRPHDAVDVFRHAATRNPLPEYQWALADALRLTGSNEEAARVEQALIQAGTRSDPRTVALFLSTRGQDAPRAVTLAERELRTRSDVFTLDALAWALHAAGRAADAEGLMRRALAEGTQDGRLFLHAAAIETANSHSREARQWLDQANRLRATLLPSELDLLNKLREGD